MVRFQVMTNRRETREKHERDKQEIHTGKHERYTRHAVDNQETTRREPGDNHEATRRQSGDNQETGRKQTKAKQEIPRRQTGGKQEKTSAMAQVQAMSKRTIEL